MYEKMIMQQQIDKKSMIFASTANPSFNQASAIQQAN